MPTDDNAARRGARAREPGKIRKRGLGPVLVRARLRGADHEGLVAVCCKTATKVGRARSTAGGTA